MKESLIIIYGRRILFVIALVSVFIGDANATVGSMAFFAFLGGVK